MPRGQKQKRFKNEKYRTAQGIRDVQRLPVRLGSRYKGQKLVAGHLFIEVEADNGLEIHQFLVIGEDPDEAGCIAAMRLTPEERWVYHGIDLNDTRGGKHNVAWCTPYQVLRTLTEAGDQTESLTAVLNARVDYCGRLLCLLDENLRFREQNWTDIEGKAQILNREHEDKMHLRGWLTYRGLSFDDRRARRVRRARPRGRYHNEDVVRGVDDDNDDGYGDGQDNGNGYHSIVGFSSDEPRSKRNSTEDNHSSLDPEYLMADNYDEDSNDENDDHGLKGFEDSDNDDPGSENDDMEDDQGSTDSGGSSDDDSDDGDDSEDDSRDFGAFGTNRPDVRHHAIEEDQRSTDYDDWLNTDSGDEDEDNEDILTAQSGRHSNEDDLQVHDEIVRRYENSTEMRAWLGLSEESTRTSDAAADRWSQNLDNHEDARVEFEPSSLLRSTAIKPKSERLSSERDSSVLFRREQNGPGNQMDPILIEDDTDMEAGPIVHNGSIHAPVDLTDESDTSTDMMVIELD